MRAKSLLTAAAAIALGACSADAAFTITGSATPGTGVNAGKFLVQFRAVATGGSTQVLGLDARLNIVNPDGSTAGAPGTLIFRKTHLDVDDIQDYDTLQYRYTPARVIVYDDSSTRTLENAGTTANSSNGPLTTFIRPQGKTPDEYTVNFSTSINPANPESRPTFQTADTDGDGDPNVIKASIASTATPNPAYEGTVKSLRVAGAYTSGISATTPPGVLIAQAFVDSATQAVQLQFNYPGDPANGGIGDQTGTAFKPADVLVAIPEPTSLTLLGLGAMGLLGRRRRNA